MAEIIDETAEIEESNFYIAEELRGANYEEDVDEIKKE